MIGRPAAACCWWVSVWPTAAAAGAAAEEAGATALPGAAEAEEEATAEAEEAVLRDSVERSKARNTSNPKAPSKGTSKTGKANTSKAANNTATASTPVIATTKKTAAPSPAPSTASSRTHATAQVRENALSQVMSQESRVSTITQVSDSLGTQPSLGDGGTSDGSPFYAFLYKDSNAKPSKGNSQELELDGNLRDREESSDDESPKKPVKVPRRGRGSRARKQGKKGKGKSGDSLSFPNSSGSESSSDEDAKPKAKPNHKTKQQRARSKSSSKSSSKADSSSSSDDDDDDEPQFQNILTVIGSNRKKRELFRTVNPPLVLQLSLHPGTTPPKFSSSNIIAFYPDSPAEGMMPGEFALELNYKDFGYNPEVPKAQPHFLGDTSDSDVENEDKHPPEDLFDFFKEEVNTVITQQSQMKKSFGHHYELSNEGTHGEIFICDPKRYTRPNKAYLDLEVDDKIKGHSPFKIRDSTALVKAILEHGYVKMENDQPESIHLHVLCAVKKVKAVKPTKKKKQKQGQTQDSDGKSVEPQFAPDDFRSYLNPDRTFGHDIILKILILPPTVKDQDPKDGSDQYLLSSKAPASFTNAETIIIEPPYTAAELQQMAIEGKLKFDTVVRASLGNVICQVKTKCLELSKYMDSKGKTLVGTKSKFYVRVKLNEKNVTWVNTTVEFYKWVADRLDKKKKRNDDGPVTVEMQVSIGKKSAEDSDFDPDEIIPVDVVNDEPVPDNLQQGYDLSQDTNLMSPMMKPPSRTGRQMRQEQTSNPEEIRELIWRATTENPDCQWHHGFTKEHFEYAVQYFMSHRFPDGRRLHEVYPCLDDEPDTWPPNSIIPHQILMGTMPAFEGQKFGFGNYKPLSDNMFSYPSFKMTREQLVEQEEARKRQHLKEVVKALGQTMRGDGASGTAVAPTQRTWRFRVALADAMADACGIVALTNDTTNDAVKLRSIYESPGVTQLRTQLFMSCSNHERAGFASNPPTYTFKVRWLNHQQPTDYLLEWIDMELFRDTTVQQLMASLPSDPTRRRGFTDPFLFELSLFKFPTIAALPVGVNLP